MDRKLFVSCDIWITLCGIWEDNSNGSEAGVISCSAVDVTSFRKCHMEACKQLDALCTHLEKVTEIELPASSKEEGKYKSNKIILC